jgi:hypothetical protein
VAILGHLLHRNPIASLWRMNRPARLRKGFLFGGGINSAKVFGALADDIGEFFPIGQYWGRWFPERQTCPAAAKDVDQPTV